VSRGPAKLQHISKNTLTKSKNELKKSLAPVRRSMAIYPVRGEVSPICHKDKLI
jgi:hypothetical protein